MFLKIAGQGGLTVWRYLTKFGRFLWRILSWPHRLLYRRWRFYRWLCKQYEHLKRPYRYGVNLTGTALAVLAIVGLYNVVQALPDLSDTWSFSDTSSYSLSDGLEASAGSVHLGGFELSADANTGALYHFNEISGNTAADSSTNGNTLSGTSTPWTAGFSKGGLALNGSTSLSAADSASISLGPSQSIEATTKFSSGFSSSSPSNQYVVDKGNYKLYFDHTTGKLTYELAGSNNNRANEPAPWVGNNYYNVTDQVVYNTDVYYALGYSYYGFGSLWRYDGSAYTTTQVGSSYANGGSNSYINELAQSGSVLYISVYANSSQSTIYSCDMSTGCTSWTSLGSLTVGNPKGISSLYYQNGHLYAGTYGNTGTDATSLFMHNGGTSWIKIGGPGSSPSSWSAAVNSGYAKYITDLAGNGTDTLYVGVYDDYWSGPSSQVWKCVISGTACTSWTLITSGNDTSHTGDQIMTYFGGNLYANSRNPGIINRYSGTGTTWTAITATIPSAPTIVGITNDGANLYASTGYISTGKVWRCSTPASACSWTDISSTAGLLAGAQAEELTYSGSTLYIGGHAASGAFGAKYTSGSWSVFPTPLVWWRPQKFTAQQSMANYAGDLYAGVGQMGADDTPAVQYYGAAVFRRQGTTWTEIGGNGLNGSWQIDQGKYDGVTAMASYNGNLYVGLRGTTTNDADIWRWNGSAWSKIGGDGLNGSWSSSYIGAYTMAVYNGQLYVGLGNSTNAASGSSAVWRYDGTNWTGLNSLNSLSNFNGGGIRKVDAMVVGNNNLYIGTSGLDNSNSARVYRYDGTAWTQLAGAGAATGNWSSASGVASLVIYGGQIYAGLNTNNGRTSAQVWRYNGTGTSWTRVAGGGESGSWSNAYRTVNSMAVYNGMLFVGLSTIGSTQGVTSSDNAGAIMQYNGSSWSISHTTYFYYGQGVQTLFAYGGQLRAGYMGYYADSENSDNDQPHSEMDVFGGNPVLTSSLTSWDTNWHKIGASYDGTTMKLYVDGTLNASLAATSTVPDNSLSLLLGGSYADLNTPDGYFNGTFDDLRLSNTARSGFPFLLYNNTAQTITLLSAVRKNGVWHWDGWANSAILNSQSLKYRLSTDGGTTWQYWNGSVWTVSSDNTQANDVATVDSNIGTLPANFDGITWQAVFKSDGTQQITLNSISLTSTSDTTAPTANASNILAKKAASDSSFSLASNGWTNGASPYFSWTAGNDSQSGVFGYCLYLGQDNTANPVTTKGMLGASPTATGDNCQFLVTDTNVDLGTAGYLATPLATSNTPYYLVIKAIDKAGNAIGTTTEFHFRFDNAAPVNPAYITAPSGFVNNKEVTLTWPATGSNGAADGNSGVIGLQYKVNNSGWFGDNHSGNGDINDLLANDGSYTTIPNPDFNNLNEGVNTVYFRTWDEAGNLSVALVTALIKLNTTGAPSEPLELEVTPTTNTANNFAFSWSRPSTLIGDAGNVTYCYVVNNLPNASNCNYTSAGATSLPAGPYATQPGINTLYLVARDESNNINYDNYSSVEFSANTPAPGMPLNSDVADVSIKATSNWRLAITWDTPADIGSGITLYKIFRSTDGTSFGQIGTSSSTSYIDINLAQQTYYYQVVACDSANNCSAPGATVSYYPTGKWTSPPIMVSDQPVVSNITTRRATVTWSTDRASDSKIAIGTTSGIYDPPETLIAAAVTSHQVDLNNLSAGTTYYIVAKWTDEDGNTGHSQELTFTTAAAPVVKEVTVDRVGLSDATISFTSVGAHRIAIYYGISDSFGGIKAINTSASESTYSLNLDGLNDGTKYFFQPVAYDSEGNAYAGNIFSFTTPPRPQIANLRFQPVAGEPTSTQEISWTTNVPTDSTVTYGVVGSMGTDITKPQMTTEHAITINGLADNSVYFLIAQSRDVNGNLAVSDRQQFKTALDTRPPKITNIEIETSIRGTGSQSRGQIIVSWKTDEPATSQVAYGTGTSVQVLNNRTAEDGALSTEHIVIVSDLPTSELYTVQPLSKDRSSNQATGNSQTAIIGRGADDVLTIVLNVLQKLFGL